MFRQKIWSNIVLFFLLVSSITIYSSCHEESRSPKKIIPAFYFWKTTFQLTPSEKQSLQQLSTQRLYLKFFDVKLGMANEPKIVAPLNIDWKTYPDTLDFCPTVFITNTTFEHLDIKDVDRLANYIHQRILVISKKKSYQEIQLDCDWSKGTKEKYFAFLKAFKILNPRKKLSCTIRLHQIKYRQRNGIPPVDRGILMIYNLEKPSVMSRINTIFDYEEITKYLKGQTPYPIDLDIALPIFSWGIHFQDGKYKGILLNLNKTKLKALGIFKKKEKLYYEITKDTVIQSVFLRKGNLLKLEEPKLSDVQKILDLSFPLLKNDSLYISLFHLNEDLINYYTNEDLQTYFYGLN